MSHPLDDRQEKGRLTVDDVARLSEQIAGLTSANLPLAPGLRATAQEMRRGRFRSTLESVAGALDRGASIDEALAAQGSRLPEHIRGLVSIGSRTGKIGQVLGRFVVFAGIGTDLRRKVWISLAYPAFSLTIAFLVFVFVCSSLVGSFDSLFREFGMQLSPATLALVSIARLFALSGRNIVELLIALVLLSILVRFFLSPAHRHELIGQIPLLGGVWRNTSLAEFCHLLAMLLESDVPLQEALRLSGEGVGDSSIERAATKMAGAVSGGVSLSHAMSAHSIFPQGLVRVIRWAEGQQSLSESLHMAGAMFEARARSQAEVVGTVFSVVVAIVILWGIGLILGGLVVPMVTMINRLSG